MDLKYIWIKEHRALKNFELNFCHDGDHFFEYKDDKILIKENPKSPISFGDNITGITAIAGQNGSGKSSFCEAVLSSTATLVNGSFGYNDFFQGIVCYGNYIFIHEDLKILNLEELESKGYTIERFKESPFQAMKYEWMGSFIKGGFIYYSNILDRRSQLRENNLANISTQYKLLDDVFQINYFSHEDRLGRPSDPNGDKYSNFDGYIIEEDYRFLQLITHFPQFIEFLGKNHQIDLRSSYTGNNRFTSKYDFNDPISMQLHDLEKSIFDDICQKFTEEKEVICDAKITKELIHKLYKLNLLSTIYNTLNPKPIANLEMINDFIYKNLIPEFIVEADVTQLLDIHKKLLDFGSVTEKFAPENMKIFKDIVDWRFKVIEYVEIPLNEETINLFRQFMALEKKTLDSRINSIVRISNYLLHPYFSGGEYSLLALFARLYNTIINYNSGYGYRDKIILFLDEPDIGFHPNWSKELLKKLLDFLNNKIVGYKFQIILTTHSPYLLSDLPKNNIRLFKRNFPSPPTLIESETDTFGANIYDLLHDSFFMEGGFIGEFAKEKIDELFADLNEKIETKKNNIGLAKENILATINIIGEPLIKRQLAKLFDLAFKKDAATLEIEIIDEQINRLQKLKDLKTKPNDSDSK